MNRNTQPPPQGQQQYFYPPPPQQAPQHSQIVVQQDPSMAAALRQMAQLHQQHFETSETQMKALENIASASSFTSTVGCIPIYDGKDKDACTEWLQGCKEASYYMGYNFRLALLQRSSQDVAKVITSLDKELSHDKLIEEIMCAFSGIPSTAAAIDKLSHIHQQPGQKLIYINKYRDLHWWCTKKLPCEETYKLTLSQFCSSLQDPIGRKLCKKLWDKRECCKLSNVQKCFNEATRAYKWYRVTEHWWEFKIFEASVEINETTYQQNPNRGGQCYNNYNNHNNNQGPKNNSYKGKTSHNGPKVQCKFCLGPKEIYQIQKLLEEHTNNPDWYTEVKVVKSTTEFIKNRTGNSAHIDKVELEALAELMDHPIEHVIYEINLCAFPEIEESNESHMWLGKLIMLWPQ